MCVVDLSRTNPDAPRRANARPRRVGLVLAMLASTAIMAGAGGLAYLVNSGNAPGLVRAARQEPAGAGPLRTQPYSPLRLAQLLGELGYLPLSWRPLASDRVAGQAHAGRTAQQAMAYNPPAGTFVWHPGYPARLRRLWRSGRSGPVIRGAVMAFQAQHGLAINGVPGPRLWRALFTAADKGERNTAGYSYAIASEGSPERLTIWHDDRIVVRSLANTGIAVAPTVPGTFPVYRRLRNTVMSGTNPDGTRYADPVSFVSYFNGKDAVHYFPRGSYGWPQSLGCVELPYQAAARAYPFLTYGSLVTVVG